MKLFFIILGILIIIAIFLNWQNNGVAISKITIKNKKIPKEFSGYKILQISDFHNSNNWKKILEKTNNCHPDLVLITGDIIDRRNYKLDLAINFIKQIKYPSYFVSGNHEAWVGDYENIIEKLKEIKVNILEDDNVHLTKNQSYINLIGVKDPGFFFGEYTKTTPTEPVEKILEKTIEKDSFNLVMSHRPEILDCYADFGADYVLTGHAHGGQFIFPFVGGLYAPAQGIFPKYYAGIYKKKSTTMYLCRGVGKSRFPFRLFNRPELVLFNLEN